ncbi:MAG: hypothetical protein AAFR07_02510 [Pseudomonadota bacterium]
MDACEASHQFTPPAVIAITIGSVFSKGIEHSVVRRALTRSDVIHPKRLGTKIEPAQNHPDSPARDGYYEILGLWLTLNVPSVI